MSQGEEARHQPSGFFVLRSPLLPFDTVRDWTRAGEGQAGFVMDRLTEPRTEEGLFLASESLHRALRSAQDDGAEPSHGVLLSAARYLARMASRPTPFGFLAGYSIGTLDSGTRLELPPARAYLRTSRIGVDHLSRLCRKLARRPEVRRQAVLRVNSSLYSLAGQVRYVATRESPDGEPVQQLQAVGEGPALRAALDIVTAAGDGLGHRHLAGRLAEDLEISEPEASGFVDQLLDTQILVPDLPPPVTGPAALGAVAELLEGRSETQEEGRWLRSLETELRRLDGSGLGRPLSDYDRVRRGLDELFDGERLDRALYTVLRKPADGLRLHRSVAEDFLRAARTLNTLFSQREDPLQTFKERFYERYEQRFVPLSEAMDEELGLGLEGYGEAAVDEAPLLKGLHFPGPPDTTEDWLPAHRALLGMVGRALAAGEEEIVLTDGLVERMAYPDPAPTPDSFATVGSLAAQDAAAVDEGDYRIWIYSAVGPSGAKILGRFCQDDPELAELVRRHLRSEEAQRPDAVFAEVVNQPKDRSANIVARPVLRGYEIPYLGVSGAPDDRQIPVSDLLVGVREGRIMIWSRSLDREVVPRVTSAHNYRTHGIATYRFLAGLQHHRAASALYWNWGPLADLPFLPRVRIGRAVLSLATWIVPSSALGALAQGSPAERRAAVESFREQRRLPRYVTLMDDDQDLLMDFHNPLMVEALSHVARRQDTAILREPFPPPDQLAARGPEGRFTSQVVIPFERRGEPHPTPPSPPPAMEHPRSHPLVGDWLYLKLYTGYSTADRLLLDTVAPLVRDLQERNRVNRWFFIRFGDPSFHLRLRLHRVDGVEAADLLSEVSAALDPLLSQGWLSKLQLDTYRPELERYGGPRGLELAERMFHVDSEISCALLPLGRQDPDLRWLLAAYSAHRLLYDLGCDPDDEIRILSRLVELYGREFHRDREMRSALAAKTRERRRRFHSLSEAAPGQPWYELLEERRRRLEPLTCAVRQLAVDGELASTPDEYVASVLHMHLNRWLRSNPRAQELVLYDLLHRLALSRRARARAAAD